MQMGSSPSPGNMFTEELTYLYCSRGCKSSILTLYLAFDILADKPD